MAMKIRERDALPHIGQAGITVLVKVIANDGTNATVVIEGCGIYVRQGQIHTVPASALQRAH